MSRPLLLLFLFCLASQVYSDCAFFSDEDGPPKNATEERRKPIVYSDDYTGPPACPEFAGVPSCCSDWSNNAMLVNFQKIATAFGNQGGGCDVCAANVERLFCYYACSPNQTDFLTWIREEEIQAWNDTSGELVTMNISRVNMTFNAQQACDLFQSCSKISFLTEISAGGSALGFFTFLYDRGMVESWTKVDIQVKNDGGLEFVKPPHTCNMTFPDGKDEWGYEIKGTCPCNFCQDSCEPLVMVPYGAITDGFSSGRVIMAYLFAALLTIGVTLVRGFRKQKNRRVSMNASGNLLENSSTH